MAEGPLSTPSTRKPVCRYGASCRRLNPQHFEDFAHPEGTAPPVAASHSSLGVPGRVGVGATAARPPAASAVLPRTRPVAAPSPPAASAVGGAVRRRCKFGCGRAARETAVKSFDTCCRQCGICQGSGEHDATCEGGAVVSDMSVSRSSSVSRNSEAAALITADLALELRRRAQACEAAGDHESAALLRNDSLDGLRSARKRAKDGGSVADLLDRLLAALSSAAPGSERDMETNERFELEVDDELERLIAELDSVVSASRFALALPETGLSRLCKFGCQRAVCAGLMQDGRPYDTCCRGCAVSKGGGTHDDSCRAPPLPETRELALASEAVEEYDGKTSGFADARVALRELGLDDEWPTSLTLREVRRRYMREALKCHPDKGPAEERDSRTDKFQRLSAAFSCLEYHLAVSGEGSPPPPMGDSVRGAAGRHGAVGALTDFAALPPPERHADSTVATEDPQKVSVAAPPVASIKSMFSCLAGTAPEVAPSSTEIHIDSSPPSRAPPAPSLGPMTTSGRWPADLF